MSNAQNCNNRDPRVNDGESKANIYLTIPFLQTCKLKLPQISCVGAQQCCALIELFTAAKILFVIFRKGISIIQM
ncbi:hypothetical protein [Nostoc sp.]|uniref:hypothetical protein n=1 Tax=Nostoc sp. TaxID=1180 RepID=UPI002FF852F3